jgi:hypothetical protein
LSLAANFDTRADSMITDLGKGCYRAAARECRSRAESLAAEPGQPGTGKDDGGDAERASVDSDATAEPGYIQDYTTFWREIVENLDGTLNRDRVARELADYHDLMGWVTEVYDEVTMGRFSKPNTAPMYIIERVNERIEEAAGDERERLRALLPYHVPCCENFAASVADLLNDHEDSP